MSDKKISAFIVKDFNDAGTEERFAKNAVVPIDDGAFGNYEAAGLVREATAEDTRAAKSETKGDA